MRFHPLKVIEVRHETADCVSVALQIPAELQESFRFSAGQYLTFRVNLEGEEIRRSYSICSSPFEQEWRVAIKKVQGGKFSTFANEQLKAGDTLEAMPPSGRFGQQIKGRDAQTYLAFAAGSGITPVLSIIKTILTTQPQSRFILIYGNQNRQSILFKTELEALKNSYMGQLSIHHIFSREMADATLFQGRIDAEKCHVFLQKLIPAESIDQCFICGPEDMIETVKQTLIEAKVDPRKIHFELFGVKKKLSQPVLSPQFKGALSRVKIRLDGTTFEIHVAYDGESILEVALRNGADLPFACKGGVCCTCRAKVVQGEIKMQVNYALEADEVAAGYILTCQSHPRSEQVTLDFDAK